MQRFSVLTLGVSWREMPDTNLCRATCDNVQYIFAQLGKTNFACHNTPMYSIFGQIWTPKANFFSNFGESNKL